MHHYDGMSDHMKIDIVGYIVYERAALPDCQARVVDLLPGLLEGEMGDECWFH